MMTIRDALKPRLRLGRSHARVALYAEPLARRHGFAAMTGLDLRECRASPRAIKSFLYFRKIV